MLALVALVALAACIWLAFKAPSEEPEEDQPPTHAGLTTAEWVSLGSLALSAVMAKLGIPFFFVPPARLPRLPVGVAEGLTPSRALAGASARPHPPAA